MTRKGNYSISSKGLTIVSRNKHNAHERKGMAILLVISLLAIGFAVVTTTLTINGTIKVGYDSSKFIVKFTAASVDGVASTATSGNKPTISTDGKTITFTTKELKTLNETSTLNFTVKNESTQYDASVTIKCNAVTNDTSSVANINVKDYVTVTPKINNSTSAVSIAASGSTTGTVVVKLIKSSINTLTGKVTCNITATPVERTSAAS